MFDVDARKPQRILALPETGKLQALYWHNNETLLIHISSTTTFHVPEARAVELHHVIAHDVGGGDGRVLPSNYVYTGSSTTTKVGATAGLVAARLSKEHVISMATAGPCRRILANCLLEVDTRTGLASIVKVGNRDTVRWYVNRDGTPVAREDWDYKQHSFKVLALDGENVREILHSSDADSFRIQGVTPDGLSLVQLDAKGSDRIGAWAVPLDGSAPKLLYEDPLQDVSGVYRDPYSNAVIGVRLSGDGGDLHWLDAKALERQQRVERIFPKRRVEVYGWSQDDSRTLARVDSPTSPPLYYLIDFASHKADIAAEEFPALASATFGDFKELTYTARDGTEIPAYLTLPPGASGGPLPLVVVPHGGPWARDYPQFNWFVQFIASLGYAVLQPQFRGSTGFGKAFEEAGFRELGGRMQDDVTDGIEALAKQGIIEPRSVCIVGAGYGGFSALVGAAFTPDRYRCAVSISGISDLRTLSRDQVPALHRYISNAQSFWAKRIGVPDDPALGARSPISAVDRISVPILLIYGENDTIVPHSQSEEMAKALRKHGKAVTVVTLEDENDWQARSESRTRVLTALDAFLRENLSKDAPRTTSRP
jgi:dipeptidyl aminopeptidase/acylaminoacyl peptidase